MEQQRWFKRRHEVIRQGGAAFHPSETLRSKITPWGFFLCKNQEAAVAYFSEVLRSALCASTFQSGNCIQTTQQPCYLTQDNEDNNEDVLSMLSQTYARVTHVCQLTRRYITGPEGCLLSQRQETPEGYKPHPQMLQVHFRQDGPIFRPAEFQEWSYHTKNRWTHMPSSGRRPQGVQVPLAYASLQREETPRGTNPVCSDRGSGTSHSRRTSTMLVGR